MKKKQGWVKSRVHSIFCATTGEDSQADHTCGKPAPAVRSLCVGKELLSHAEAWCGVEGDERARLGFRMLSFLCTVSVFQSWALCCFSVTV